jgi:hypothetical protein
MKFQSTTTALVPAASNVSALGINCKGSSNCGSLAPDLAIASIRNYVDLNRFYTNGEKIACETRDDEIGASQSYATCAFCQNGGGAPGNSIKTLSQDLVDQGCTACGNTPFYNSDVSKGN